MSNLYEIRDLSCSYDKTFVAGRSKVVLEIKELDIPRGEIVFIVGESGIGKSTILEVLGMMNNTIIPGPNAQFVFYDHADGPSTDLLQLWEERNDQNLSSFRLRHFSFIFQSTNLMRNFTAFENIALTRMLQGYSQEEAFDRASAVLGDLGLPHIDRNRMAQELSGGQQQRLAFARAILPDFTVLFGDEPTGNLDVENAQRAMSLLSRKLSELKGASAIIVTHDMHLATMFAHHIIKIRKQYKDANDIHDDGSFYGVVDPECVYACNAERTYWSNGSKTYSVGDFESFLKSVS